MALHAKHPAKRNAAAVARACALIADLYLDTPRHWSGTHRTVRVTSARETSRHEWRQEGGVRGCRTWHVVNKVSGHPHDDGRLMHRPWMPVGLGVRVRVRFRVRVRVRVQPTGCIAVMRTLLVKMQLSGRARYPGGRGLPSLLGL